MIIKLSIILLFAAFIVLLAYWVVRTEEKPRKKSSFLDPNKSYQKASELGLKFPNEYRKMGLKSPNQYEDILPGV